MYIFSKSNNKFEAIKFDSYTRLNDVPIINSRVAKDEHGRTLQLVTPYRFSGESGPCIVIFVNRYSPTQAFERIIDLGKEGHLVLIDITVVKKQTRNRYPYSISTYPEEACPEIRASYPKHPVAALHRVGQSAKQQQLSSLARSGTDTEHVGPSI